MFNVALFEPEIPPNTGNIIRLCANTGCALHLVAPLGFSMDDQKLRRAGLDYREYAEVVIHESYAELCGADGVDPSRLFAISTRGTVSHSEARLAPGDTFLFGPETRGLPQALLDELPESQVLRLPMVATSRSLNLANAAAVVVYEAWRQNQYGGEAPALS